MYDIVKYLDIYYGVEGSLAEAGLEELYAEDDFLHYDDSHI